MEAIRGWVWIFSGIAQSLLFKSLYLYPISHQNAKICPLLTIHPQKVSIPLLISFASKPSPGDTNMKLKLDT